MAKGKDKTLTKVFFGIVYTSIVYSSIFMMLTALIQANLILGVPSWMGFILNPSLMFGAGLMNIVGLFIVRPLTR